MMEAKNMLETPFGVLKTKIYKETIQPVDTMTVKGGAIGDIWPNAVYWIKAEAKKKDRARLAVPSSSSSPTLPLIQRSTTGSSISSVHSTLSISSHPWALSGLSLPPVPRRGSLPDSRQKRARVIQELMETEKDYDADLRLVKEIYYAQAPFNASEKRQIFLNLNELLLFEQDFLCHLNSLKETEDIRPLCRIFSTLICSMESVYAEYCKKHEDATTKLQELSRTNKDVQAYLKTCTQHIQGRTKSWDLPSLLIKPVQRILKYPLLFKEILSYTAEEDLAYESLVFTLHALELLADRINEIKKRKDLVEQLLVNDHKKKVSDQLKKEKSHSLNKRWTRKVHLKRNPSMDTQDMAFNTIYRQFEERQERARSFEKEVLAWLTLLKEAHQNLEAFLTSFGDQDKTEDTLRLMSKDLVFTEAMIQASVCDRIDSFLKLFKNPMHVIQKRNRKWIDYDRACHVAGRGEVPDKQLQASTEAYHSLNAHLLEELPLFLSLTSSYFDIILDEFVGIQAFFWKQRELAWQPLAQTATISWADFLHEPSDPEGIFDQPVLEAMALADYETKEQVKVKKGDRIQVWFVASHHQAQWWYGTGPRSSTSGWFPSHVCRKLNV